MQLANQLANSVTSNGLLWKIPSPSENPLLLVVGLIGSGSDSNKQRSLLNVGHWRIIMIDKPWTGCKRPLK